MQCTFYFYHINNFIYYQKGEDNSSSPYYLPPTRYSSCVNGIYLSSLFYFMNIY
nr:MAG TPA: hypothetical protein [Caudoviricetes sp.]